MIEKPLFLTLMFTFKDGSERYGFFNSTGSILLYPDATPCFEEPVSWEPFEEWVARHIAKPKINPPDDDRYIMIEFEDGVKKVGYYYNYADCYRFFQDNDMNAPILSANKRVVKWEYLSDWINFYLNKNV